MRDIFHAGVAGDPSKSLRLRQKNEKVMPENPAVGSGLANFQS